MIHKAIQSFLCLASLIISIPVCSAEIDDVKKILAVQQAEIQMLKKALQQTKIEITAAQSTANTANSTASSKPSLNNACVISPNWQSCPDGFRDSGNFYACFPIGTGLGVDSTGMACGGPYDDRHVTICCR